MADPAPDVTRKPDYRLEFEPSSQRVKVVYNGVTVAESRRAIICHETRLPAVYYLPREDVRMDLTERTDYRTYCPFKGNASYWNLTVGDQTAEQSLWSYEDPLPEAEPLREYIAFYRNRMDAWYEEDEEVSIDPVTDTHVHGNPLVDWLMRDAWEATSTSELVARFARQLVASGVPLQRLTFLVRTLHPQVMGAVHVWTRDTDRVESAQLSHASADEEAFLSSPFVPIFDGRGGLRRRLEGPEAELDFPILRDLAKQGATDYVGMPLRFSDGQIHALTLTTDVPGGFQTANLGHIYELLPLVSRLAEVHSLRHTARTLLDTYLGAYTGGRVLNGLIKRGDGEEIPAVIWWADLRDSTGLTERLSRAEYLELLNEFFESTAGSVIDHGGEVLKFIGDAVMAIFPLEESDAAIQALAATDATLARIAELNEKRAARSAPEIRIALALHEGDVMYGNIGVAGRLDFTVTGPAVNEVTRLEAIGKQLGRVVVASESFARLAPERLVSLGRYSLRGVSSEQEVYALDDPPRA